MESEDSDSMDKVNEGGRLSDINPQANMDSDSEEEEIIIHKKKRVNRTFLADSDEESDAQEMLSENKSEDGMEEKTEDQETKPTNSEKPISKKRIAVLDDSSESENEASNAQPTENMDVNSEENKEVTAEAVAPNKPKILKNSELLDELFDAEESDEDRNESGEEDGENKEKTPVAMDEGYHGDHGESEEEDDGDPQISAALAKKLAKGASKKPKSSKAQSNKPHRMRKEDIQQIHSESQRIMREREVKMPYHQPKKLGLSVFLARTQQKQEAMKKITPGRWKQPDSALLLKSKLDDQICDKNEQKTSGNVEEDSVVPSENQETSNKTLSITEVELVKKQLDLDDLPDLLIEKSSAHADDTTITASASKVVKAPRLDAFCKNDLDSKLGEETGENICKDISSDINPIFEETNNKRSESISLKSDQKAPEQDSGYLTTPLNSSEEESTGSHSESGDSQEKDKTSSLNTNAIDTELVKGDSNTCLDDGANKDNNEKLDCVNDEVMVTEGNSSYTTTKDCTTVTTPGGSSKALKPKLRKTPVLSGATLPAPRLSGNPDSFIDLDDGSAEANDRPKSGVRNLLERLMKHSAKRPKRSAKDVEISTVVKDKDWEKEELKLDKFTYHIDAEEEEDPSLQVPGAKLLKLKEKLKEKMTADREKARQLRSQLMDFDNEENGFDEGELTDQTDTDDEEVDEEEEEEEDEMDMGEYTDQEKAERENNPFVDDEAESEGDDDMEEGGLHLQLDSHESQGDESSTSKLELPKKDFLKSALSKTKSMDLFDEEANVDSPTMSQQSGADSNYDISDRPFEQLSQGTQIVPDNNQDNHPKIQSLEPQEYGSTNSASLFKDTSFNTSMDMSFELMGSMIPAGQGTGKKNRADADSPCSKSSAQSSRRYSVLSLPVENTQDLFAFSEASPTHYPKQTTQSHDLNFHLDESQSRLLDDDGLLKLESTKKSSRRQLMLDEKELPDQNEDMGELLHLCSGRFTEDKGQSSKKSLFSGDSQVESTQSMNELMGLCSGQFSEKPVPPPLSRSSSAATESSSNLLRSDSTEPFMMATQPDSMNELLGLCSGRFTGDRGNKGAGIQKTIDDEEEDADNMSPKKKLKSRKKKRKRIIVGSDNDSDGEAETGNHGDEDENEAVDSDDFEVCSNQGSDNPEDEEDELARDVEQSGKFVGFRKEGKLNQQFVEAEAELSGSEAASDEDYDLDEEDDLLEMEDGDNDVTLNQEELRNQVGRVHLKSVIDEDKKQIRLMQEMYLADGDLHNEGGGRQRKFRWRNIDDSTQGDMFGEGSDEEVTEEDGDQEKWRLQRFEREKFLQEMKENEENKTESQHIKLGNVCFKPKKAKSQQLKSSENLVNESDKEVQKSKPSVPSQPKPALSSSQGLFKVPAKRAGSFLSRSKTDLAKIVEKSKPVGSVSGPRNSRNFVFQTVSEENKGETLTENKPAVKRANSTPKQSVAKKPKLEKTTSMPKDSIFNLY